MNARIAVITLALANVSQAVPLSEFMNDPQPRVHIFKTLGSDKLTLAHFQAVGAKPGEKRPAAVWIHGGAWRGGDAEGFYPQARYLASRGAVGFSINYRLLKPNGPFVADCLADCKSAIRYLRSHADELGVDPARIAVIGDSAGGHLAAALGTVEGFDDPADNLAISAAPNAMILCNAIFDMTEGAWINFVIAGKALDPNPPPEVTRPSEAQTQLARKLSPLFNVRPGQPPALVMHGLNDRIVLPEQSRQFDAAMKQAGNTCTLDLIEGAKHAFVGIRYTAPEPVVVSALQRIDGFLVSLGWLSGAPTLETSVPPAWVPMGKAYAPGG